MATPRLRPRAPARRDLLRTGLYGVGLGAVGVPALFSRKVALGAEPAARRILVVVELSGANDGLNTVVPYTDDAYYRARPSLGIPPDKLRKIDDRFGFQSTMAGFERLYKDGRLAIVHGVGYDQPSFSHFTSMAYWHTGAPNSGETYGWLGRLADSLDPLGSKTGSSSNWIAIGLYSGAARDEAPRRCISLHSSCSLDLSNPAE